MLEFSIGWDYGEETQRLNINDYEQNRGDRKVNLEMVLSRKERETLLLESNVDMKDIVACTRAALKTKFQRKQTVINARKLSKLEEVIEITSRRLKKALFPRTRINDPADELIEFTTSRIIEADHTSTANETIPTSLDGEDDKSLIHVTEPDEDEMEKLIESSFVDSHAVDECGEGDDNANVSDEFTLGATTLGNTSAFSPSIIEMEKFYRELELEMFGEETELPSMLGQTLEIPLDAQRDNKNLSTASNDVKVIPDNRSFDANASSSPQPAHLEKYPSRAFRDESQSSSYDDRAFGPAQDPSWMYNDPNTATRNRSHQHYSLESQLDQPPFYYAGSQPHQSEYEMDSKFTTPHVPYSESTINPLPHYPTTTRRPMPVAQNGLDPNFTQYNCDYYGHLQHSNGHNCSNNPRQRSGSFDSSYNIAPTQNANQYLPYEGRLRQSAQAHYHSQYLPGGSSLDTAEFSARYSAPGGQYEHWSSPRAARRSNFNEPRVRHMPMLGHLSANQWMEGSNQERYFCNNDSTVIITEGDC